MDDAWCWCWGGEAVGEGAPPPPMMVLAVIARFMPSGDEFSRRDDVAATGNKGDEPELAVADDVVGVAVDEDEDENEDEEEEIDEASPFLFIFPPCPPALSPFDFVTFAAVARFPSAEASASISLYLLLSSSCSINSALMEGVCEIFVGVGLLAVTTGRVANESVPSALALRVRLPLFPTSVSCVDSAD